MPRSIPRNPPLPTLAAGLLALVLILAGCSSGGTGEAETAATTPATTATADGDSDAGDLVEAGDNAFRITALPERYAPLASVFSKYVDVWGVSIVATATTDDAKVLHAANVMAQYLDNDADGTVDDQPVLDAMVESGAILLMAGTPEEFESIDNADAVFDFVGQAGQDLYGSETNPDQGFDASLEEVHHLILNAGWSTIYPDQLAQAAGSGIADAMDIARGGRFERIPSNYPADAWYTYDDETCDYTCMITEYTYWAHTSLLGAQEGRSAEIGREWKLETPDKARNGDPAATAVLTAPELNLPTVIPDGKYTG